MNNIQHEGYDQMGKDESPVQECSHELELAYQAYDAALKAQAQTDLSVIEAQYALDCAESVLIPDIPDLKNEMQRKAWLTQKCAQEENDLLNARRLQIVARCELGVAENKVSYWRANLRLLEVQAGLIQARQR